MRAITILQPWASLIACGAKKYETRSWKTPYRGKIAIHAGKTLWGDLQNIPITPGITWTAMKCALSPVQYFEKLPLSAVIATAELVECREIHGTKGRGASYYPGWIDAEPANDEDDVYYPEGDELLFGDWTPGRYAWELANVKMLPEPIPAKGKLSLWEWESGVDGE